MPSCHHGQVLIVANGTAGGRTLLQKRYLTKRSAIVLHCSMMHAPCKCKGDNGAFSHHVIDPTKLSTSQHRSKKTTTRHRDWADSQAARGAPRGRAGGRAGGAGPGRAGAAGGSASEGAAFAATVASRKAERLVAGAAPGAPPRRRRPRRARGRPQLAGCEGAKWLKITSKSLIVVALLLQQPLSRSPSRARRRAGRPGPRAGRRGLLAAARRASLL